MIGCALFGQLTVQKYKKYTKAMYHMLWTIKGNHSIVIII